MKTENAIMVVGRVTHRPGTDLEYTATHAKTGVVARGKTPDRALRNLLRQLSRRDRGPWFRIALAASLLMEDDVRRHLPEALADEPLPHGGSTLRAIPWSGEAGGVS